MSVQHQQIEALNDISHVRCAKRKHQNEKTEINNNTTFWFTITRLLK